ncbi:MAG TPA: TIGR02466 family protein [Pseudomonadales bacterium]|nr:TIGR02466 family protein [Pseudomonadales bacterium]
MTVSSFFPTLVYSARLQRSHWRSFNDDLLHECLQLREDDTAGVRWSKQNYPGGYTSYNSVSYMYQVSPTFAALRDKLDRHVEAYVDALEWDMQGRELAMTDCWVNIMPRQVVHPLHLHPLATISGTYYVQAPGGASGLKLEDPRLDRFMAAPPRKADCRPENKQWIVIPAEAGNVVLFESWLRHEVPPNPSAKERVSISFNYNWF